MRSYVSLNTNTLKTVSYSNRCPTATEIQRLMRVLYSTVDGFEACWYITDTVEIGSLVDASVIRTDYMYVCMVRTVIRV